MASLSSRRGDARGFPCQNVEICGYTGFGLASHLRRSPSCRTEVPRGEKRPKRDPEVGRQLFVNELTELVGRSLFTAHIDKYMSMTELDAMRSLILACATLTLDYVGGEFAMLDHRNEAFPALETARSAYNELPSAGMLVKQQMQCYARAIPRTLGFADNSAAKRGAVFFSTHTLLAIILQESKTCRELTVASSEKWKSGVLYKSKPDVLSDAVQGDVFLNRQDIVGKCTASEIDDLRVALQVWTDEFTPIDGLSQKARFHKYGTVLAALLNLPPRLRHYADHILLLLLYNSRYSKANGGLSRLLTGIGSDGTKYDDTTNLAAEIRLGVNSPLINIPDVDDPSKQKTWRLRVFVIFVSLDWLAVGDFGPFAGSVSARRPCWKCKWTANCPCAFIAPNDPRRAPGYVLREGEVALVHTEHCKGYEPRTHDSVITLTRELHALEVAGIAGVRNKTRIADFRTGSGIFSSHSAAQGLLSDVVDGITPDAMHIFLCGLSRYLTSWCTDEWIGDGAHQFTWAALNKAKNANQYLKGHRVPGTTCHAREPPLKHNISNAAQMIIAHIYICMSQISSGLRETHVARPRSISMVLR